LSLSAWAVRSLSVVLITLVMWGGIPLGDLYGTSRPEPVDPVDGAARWPAPPAIADHVSAPMMHRRTGLPVRLAGPAPRLDLHVEQSVVDRYGIEPVEAAVERWSSVRGARLDVRLVGIVDDGVERNVFDGVNRIFMNMRTCVRPELAKVHVDARVVDDRFDQQVVHLHEANIGLCPNLRPELVEAVIAHEIGHAVGFGHLCDADDRHVCMRPSEDESKRCRVMYSAATTCQTWDERDEIAVRRLYPLAPRIAGADLVRTAARTAHVLVPDVWREQTVVVVDADVDEPIRWAAAAAAGAPRAPVLVAPPDGSGCVSGEFARELGRIAAFGGEVLLVGPAAMRCAPEMERWQLDTTIVWGGAPGLARIVLERVRSPGDVVIAHLTPGGEVPAGAVAAALAGQTRAPLLFAVSGVLGTEVLEVLGEIERPGVVLVGDHDLLPARIDAYLRGRYGVTPQRVLATSDAAGSLRLAEHVAYRDADRALVASSRADDALLAVAYAPLVGAAPLLIDSERIVPGTGRLLGERLNGGFVVGSGLPARFADQINVWMDGRDD
jgi:hypothetical protein